MELTLFIVVIPNTDLLIMLWSYECYVVNNYATDIWIETSNKSIETIETDGIRLPKSEVRCENEGVVTHWRIL